MKKSTYVNIYWKFLVLSMFLNIDWKYTLLSQLLKTTLQSIEFLDNNNNKAAQKWEALRMIWGFRNSVYNRPDHVLLTYSLILSFVSKTHFFKNKSCKYNAMFYIFPQVLSLL